MNKWSKIAASTFFTLTVLSPGLASADDMNPMVDYSQVQDVMKDGMDLVPLRQIAESLGYQVTWNNDESSVTLVSNGSTNSMDTNMMDTNNKDMAYTVKIKIDSPEVWVGMSETMLSYAPILINDRTYVTKDFIEGYIANQMMMK